MKNDKNVDHVDFDGEWHTFVPDRLYDANISGMAKMLWVSLKRYASRASPNPFPGRYTLCKILKCGTSAFKGYRQELERAGWLKTVPRKIDGRFCGNLYTLIVPHVCKQKHASPGVEFQPPEIQPPEIQSAEKHTHKEYQSEGNQLRSNTTTTAKAAGAAGDGGGKQNLAACAAKEKTDDNKGRAFMTRWVDQYKVWFGVPYIQKSGEAARAKQIINQLECRPKDLLAYVYRMWINTQDYDYVATTGFDAFFNQIKGSRNVLFFLKYLEEIAAEQERPYESAIPVRESEFRELEAIIELGRPDPAGEDRCSP